jgi:hypothetical protein
MDPSTAQYAGIVPDAATHRGGLSATPDTGSPMAEIGIALPTLSTVQSASEIVLLPSMVAVCRAAAVRQAVLTKRRTRAIHFCVLFGISRHRIQRSDPISNRVATHAL